MGLLDKAKTFVDYKVVKGKAIKKVTSRASSQKRKSSKKIKQLETDNATLIKNIGEYQTLFPDPLIAHDFMRKYRNQGQTFEKGTPVPAVDILPMWVYYSQQGGIISPVEVWPWQYIQYLASQTESVRLSINKLRQEIFRQGWEFEPTNVRSCPQCGKAFDFEAENCDFCGYRTVEADESSKELIENVFERRNAYGKNFHDVLNQIEDDLQILDNGFLIAIKEYQYNVINELIGSNVKHFVRGDPTLMRIVTAEDW